MSRSVVFRSKKPLLSLVKFIQNRYKGHIGRDRYETEIGKSFAVVHLDTRIEQMNVLLNDYSLEHVC